MYEMTWITSQLAAGYAPMSYAELESIKEQGIDAIVNLCGEFSDLHEIEEKAGFEVYFLPTPDEWAPDMRAMEKALAWLDEAIYLQKKILVHCRHGHGRTGTFVSAYLLRRGLGLKRAEKILKNTRANPTNYNQWKLLRKYHKQEGILTLAEPQLENKAGVDLKPFLHEYQVYQRELELELNEHGGPSTCGMENTSCCSDYFELQLAESVWIHTSMNKKLTRDERQQVGERAIEVRAVINTVRTLHQRHPSLRNEPFAHIFSLTKTLCPLYCNGKCALYGGRPLRCQWHNINLGDTRKEEYREMLMHLSQNMFLALTGAFSPEGALMFTIADTVSGRFVQKCFQAMQQNNQFHL